MMLVFGLAPTRLIALLRARKTPRLPAVDGSIMQTESFGIRMVVPSGLAKAARKAPLSSVDPSHLAPSARILILSPRMSAMFRAEVPPVGVIVRPGRLAAPLAESPVNEPDAPEIEPPVMVGLVSVPLLTSALLVCDAVHSADDGT